MAGAILDPVSRRFVTRNQQIDDLSPRTIGEDKITLTLSDTTPNPIAFGAVQIDIDTTRADAEGGLILPLELFIQAPTDAGFRTDVFRRTLPESFVFFPISAGQHLVLIREVGHNRWHGKLVIIVEGEDLDEVQPSPV